MWTRIEATYRVVTPLFCAGAGQDRAEIRLPSFKGVLRYWWRALAWSRLDGDLGAIQRREDELFGSSGGGQSRVVMRLTKVSDPRTVETGSVLTVSATSGHVVGEGARYLGYGVMQAFGSKKKNTESGQLTRPCLRAPIDFTVALRCRDLDKTMTASLTAALKALGLLGGMGAKSRKGYGSLVLRSLRIDGDDLWSPPQSLEDLKEAVASLTTGHPDSKLPDFTALSRNTRHVLLTCNKRDTIHLLDLVGRELVRYRSWGKDGSILGGAVASEKNFKDDHDLMNGGTRRFHPRRIAFGLPHNYGKPSHKQVGPDDSQLDRRASPLFIHLHQCGETPLAVLSLVAARFLPANRSDISVGGSRVRVVDERALYQPIHDFLDRLLDPERRQEPFTRVVEVE